MAAEKALELVKAMAVDVSAKDKAMLKKIAATAMTGKDTDNARDFLSDMVVKCMDATMEKDANGKYYVEKKNLVLEKKTGGRVEDSRIVEGVLVDKGRVNFQMPEKLTNVKVLAMDIGIEAKDTQFDAEFKIRQPGQFQEFVGHGGRADQGPGRQDREAWASRLSSRPRRSTTSRSTTWPSTASSACAG